MLIGVALYFGEYVLVEFGPIGNSAYIYRADVFQSKILNQPSWQSRELVDRNITLQGSRPGSLWHVAGWMNTADRFLMQIVKRPRMSKFFKKDPEIGVKCVMGDDSAKISFFLKSDQSQIGLPLDRASRKLISQRAPKRAMSFFYGREFSVKSSCRFRAKP
jgi:hypothetical protein